MRNKNLSSYDWLFLKINVKKSFFIIFFIFIISCSVGTGGSNTTAIITGGVAPMIANLRIVPSSAEVGEGGGRLTVKAIFDFIDEDGDIRWAKVLNLSNGSEETTSLLSFFGEKSATVDVVGILVNTRILSNTNFQVTVLDQANNESNRLIEGFEVKINVNTFGN